uniref:Glutaredoxin domain-containing protein n=1 Tax=Oryza glumipatula TaxID=40148 RepID=A0A0E0A720_9ORYZ
MGCKGSKHALHGGVPAAAAAAERRMCSSRRSVAVRSAAVSFAAGVGDGVMLVKGGGGGGVGYTSATVGQEKRCRRAPPRTPTKTPLRAPEEINVWELMAGLDYDEEEEEEEEVVVVDGHGGERQVKSAPGSPAFDPDVLPAFRKAVEELPPESPPRDAAAAAADDDDKKGEIQKFPGVVRARIILFQKEIDAKLAKKEPPPPPPPPESARRVVVYLTSLRGIRQTYEDCCATASILRSYGVRVDERDLSLHAGYKDELRAALGDGAGGGGGVPGQGRPLPQVFVDGCHRSVTLSGGRASLLLVQCAGAVGL